MHIGLIGGIGPAATDLYYRAIISGFAARARALDLTMAHADAATLRDNVEVDDQAAQAAIYDRLTRRLGDAGADVVVVTSFAGHFCIEAFKPISVLPVIDLLESAPPRLKKMGLGRIGMIGTRKVMQSKMYGRLSEMDVVVPEGSVADAVHETYVEMAVSGAVTEDHRQTFFAAGRDLCDNLGAEAVLLAGTDLFLAFDGHDPGFRVIDCALLHVDEIVERATA